MKKHRKTSSEKDRCLTFESRVARQQMQSFVDETEGRRKSAIQTGTLLAACAIKTTGDATTLFDLEISSKSLQFSRTRESHDDHEHNTLDLRRMELSVKRYERANPYTRKSKKSEVH